MKSLRSTAVPALVVAAFCKKLCRIAMRSSPSTALFVIPLVTELLTYHPSLYPLLQVEDKEDVYEVASVRKALPGVEEEDEAERMKRKQRATEWVDDEEEEDEEDDDEESVVESEEDEEKRGDAKKMEEEEEVVAEVDDRKPVLVRSTAVLSSEIVQNTLKRMERKRQQLETRPELPEKLPHIEYSFRSRFSSLL